MYRISIIGAGNVATQFAIAFQKAGHEVLAICNRDAEKADQLCRIIGRYKGKARAVSSYCDIPQSDIIFITVSDSAIGEVIANLDNVTDNTLYVHTSGATPISIFGINPRVRNFGVFYPLMTLSKHKNLDIRMVPFLLEGCSREVEEILADLVKSLKAEFNFYTSEKRLQMHTAAVFTTNFVNYILSLAYDISSPDFTFLLPSAIEAVRKAFLHTPEKAQTGPALRGDMESIRRHLELLKDKGFVKHAEIYSLLTDAIMERYNVKDKV